MKRKMSVSIEKETIELLEKLVKDGRFRNKSHLVEYSINKFLQGEESGT